MSFGSGAGGKVGGIFKRCNGRWGHVWQRPVSALQLVFSRTPSSRHVLKSRRFTFYLCSALSSHEFSYIDALA